jgi:hypothetical protein
VALDEPERFKVSGDAATALRLILVTAARPGMVSGVAGRELRDLVGPSELGPHWSLSAARMKAGSAFITPLDTYRYQNLSAVETKLKIKEELPATTDDQIVHATDLLSAAMNQVKQRWDQERVQEAEKEVAKAAVKTTILSVLGVLFLAFTAIISEAFRSPRRR